MSNQVGFPCFCLTVCFRGLSELGFLLFLAWRWKTCTEQFYWGFYASALEATFLIFWTSFIGRKDVGCLLTVFLKGGGQLYVFREMVCFTVADTFRNQTDLQDFSFFFFFADFCLCSGCTAQNRRGWWNSETTGLMVKSTFLDVWLLLLLLWKRKM